MKSCLYGLIFTIFFLIPIFCYSQINTVDSLQQLLKEAPEDTSKIRTLIKLSQNTWKDNMDTADYYATRVLKLAEKVKDVYWLAWGYTQAARIQYYQQNFSDALNLYSKSADYFGKLEDQKENYLKIKLAIANIYAKTGRQKEGMQINFDVAHQADSLKLFIVKIRALHNIGDIYRLQRDSVKALKYMQMSYNIADSIDDPFLKFIIEHDLALVYDLNGDTEKAIKMFKNCLQYSQFLQRNDSARIYSNIGRIYVKDSNYVEGEKYLFKSLELRKNLDVPFSLSHLYNEIATLYLNQGMYEKAVKYGEKSYAIAKELENIRLLEDITRNLSDAYLGLKNYKKANEIEREYSAHLKYLFEKDKVEAIAEMETRYETAKKEKEIAILEGEQKLAQRTKNALLLGIILLFVISALSILLLRLRIKKKAAEADLANSQLELNKKELENKQLQLNNFTEIIKEKNRMLEEITAKSNAGDIDVDFDKLQKLSSSIILTEDDWQSFQDIFEQVHDNFFTRLRHKLPELTPSEKRLISLMKLNLSNKEISNMLGISPASVVKTKYRLKKKLDINESKELEVVIEEI